MNEDCDHCWHATRTTVTLYPPQIEVICCWCGEIRFLAHSVESPNEEHGSFVSDEVSWTLVVDEDG